MKRIRLKLCMKIIIFRRPLKMLLQEYIDQVKVELSELEDEGQNIPSGAFAQADKLKAYDMNMCISDAVVLCIDLGR